MDNIKKTIGTRINALLAQEEKKQKDLAAYLGVTDNTVSYFVSGARCPNIEQIIKIAKYFDVSSDYLLSITDVKTTDKSVKAICEYTGLSESNINTLHRVGCKNFHFMLGAVIDKLTTVKNVCILENEYKKCFYKCVRRRAYKLFINEYCSQNGIASELFKQTNYEDISNLLEKDIDGLSDEQDFNFKTALLFFDSDTNYLIDTFDLCIFRQQKEMSEIWECINSTMLKENSEVMQKIEAEADKLTLSDITSENVSYTPLIDINNLFIFNKED